MESVSLLTKYSSRNLSEYASIGVPVGALNVVRRVMGDSSRYELDCEGLEQSDQMQYPVSTPSSSTRVRFFAPYTTSLYTNSSLHLSVNHRILTDCSSPL